MGKSIRSKVKRANRSQLRKEFSDPIVRKRQEAIAKRVAKNIEERNGSSIMGLRSALQGESDQKKNPDEMDDDTDGNNDENTKKEKEEEEVDLEKPSAFKKPLVLKGEGLNPFGHMSRKEKASNPSAVIQRRLKEDRVKNLKPKPQSKKKLEWFK